MALPPRVTYAFGGKQARAHKEQRKIIATISTHTIYTEEQVARYHVDETKEIPLKVIVTFEHEQKYSKEGYHQ